MSDSLHAELSPRDQYIERVEALLRDVTVWCEGQGLRVEVVPFTVREECEGEYEVPGRKIWSDDVLLAKLVPIASKVIAADGRVDVVGWLGSHALLFQGEAVLGPKSATIVTHRPGRASTARIVRNIEVDGWYWFEARVRRPVLIDEALFLDLLTDVSNYEF